MKIRTQADIAELEKLPVGERIRQKNVFEILRDSGNRHADRVAFRALSGTAASDPTRDVTYAEMLKRVIQTANLLHASGVGRNEAVTILMAGVPETFYALWGAEIAAVANPVNYFLNATQIAGVMKEAGTKALVAADPSLFPDIWPKVEEIRAA